MALPDWLDPLPDAEQMRAVDRWAIEERGVASLDLMERAGEGLAAVVEEIAGRGPVAVACGAGNNGGDGLVAARLLRERGRDVRVLLAAEPGALRGDARANLERLPGTAPEPFAPEALAGAAVLVDALLGTGFAGAVREPVRLAITALNEHRAPTVAADVPSGVDASTGVVEDVAVRAAATATFHRAKPGLWIAPGKAHAGAVRVIDIGMPDGEPGTPDVGLLARAALGALPRRAAPGTKFSSGHVLVAGGSEGLTGSVCLAAEAAMRTGAGYVTACVPRTLNPVFEVKLTEVMTRPLADRDGAIAAQAADEVLEAAGRGGALVLGMGIGRGEGAVAFARDVARRADVALVLDADGLNAHAGRLADLRERSAPTVLTPHAGELGRLLDVESDAIGAERLRHARTAAVEAQAIVVLKGDDTLVAAPDGRVAVSPGGAHGLATAGTGDVLSGVVGAVLAAGLDPFHAACAAVRLHRDAGLLAAERLGAEGMIASDVIRVLPHARHRDR